MSSFLDELREDAEQTRRAAEKILAIPGSRFAVRFRPPPRAKLDSFLSAYRMGGLSEADELQFLVDCHDEVIRRDGEPADPDGGPLRFDGSDERWGLGENGTARQAVAKLYRHDAQPLVVSNHVEALANWLAGLDAETVRWAEGKPAGAET